MIFDLFLFYFPVEMLLACRTVLLRVSFQFYDYRFQFGSIEHLNARIVGIKSFRLKDHHLLTYFRCIRYRISIEFSNEKSWIDVIHNGKWWMNVAFNSIYSLWRIKITIWKKKTRTIEIFPKKIEVWKKTHNSIWRESSNNKIHSLDVQFEPFTVFWREMKLNNNNF